MPIGPAATFGLAALVQLLILLVLAFLRPDKAAEGAIPIGIIICGLAGPHLGRSLVQTGVSAAALGALNAGALMMTSGNDDLSPSVRWIASLAFCAGTALGTWAWSQYDARRKASERAQG